jgi:hypothetical protein
MLFQGLPLRSNQIGYGRGHRLKVGRQYALDWVLKYREAKLALHLAKERLSVQANAHRSERSFEVGDYVLLSSKHLRLKRPHSSKKFCPLFVGPFQVLERIGRSAYRLKLPATCKMHDVINISKLWKYRTDPSRPSAVPAPILIEDAEHFEVQDILAVRGKPESRHYLVQWKGHDCMYSTWEPEKNLDTCRELLDEFTARRSTRAAGATCFMLTAERPDAVPTNLPVAYRRAHLVQAPYGYEPGSSTPVDSE